ncbi:MAG TPA: acyl-CoA dehydrogenase [Acidimicrobiales bacterium]|jgi:acyl-CoA dehydrogenase
MDFSLNADQEALRDLSRQILADRCTPEHLKAVAATDTAVDLDLWRTMAAAGLAGIGLPAAAGGGGRGFLDVCIVLEEVARAAAPVPALAVMGLAGPALAHFGGPSHLDGVAAGERIVTAALHEPAGDVRVPSTRVRGGRLTGVKVCVPAGPLASTFVVSAADGLYVVAADAPGVAVERQDTTSGVPEARVTFDGAAADGLAGPDAIEWLLDRATAAQCVMMAGLCDAAVRLTADYAKERVQFERPIATFQAVGQRVADARIDAEGVRLTAWQAAWRLDAELPAAEQVAAAKYWAAEGGQRVVHAAQHVHGGVGVDRDYPLHRYFLAAKQLELDLGGAAVSLVRLGRMLAETPVH